MSFVDFCLRQRSALRKLCMGLFCPQKLSEEASRAELNESLRQHWPEYKIQVYELIREDWEPSPAVAPTAPLVVSPQPNAPPTGNPQPKLPNFIVFIDPAFDLDWIFDGNTSAKISEKITEAEAVGGRNCKHLPIPQLLEFKRLIGHAIVAAIRSDGTQSTRLSKEAAQYLRDRTIERSRYWSLREAHLLTTAFAVLLYLVNCREPRLFGFLPQETQASLLLASFGGLLGAYLSIVQKAGKGQWDSSSGVGLHRIEILTQLFTGILLGGIAFAVAHSRHAPKSIAAAASDAYALFILGIGAGLFERFIPKMISRYTEKE